MFKSSSRSQRDLVCLVPWTRALLQFLRRSSLHVCTVVYRLSLTDIGTGVWSQEEVALPILMRNAVFKFLSFRIGHCAGTAPIWQKHVAHPRRELKRARADLQLADQDTSKYGTKGYCPLWDEAFVSALRRNIKSGMGARVLSGLLQIDACNQSTVRLGNSG